MTNQKYMPISADSIQANLHTDYIGSKIIIHKSTSSTNDIAGEYAKGGRGNHGLVVLAESQSCGRGRRGNKWFDKPGMSLLFSVVLFDVKILSDMLSLTVAVALAEAIETFGIAVGIKWPNDIIINDKKVGGVLVESLAKKTQTDNYILGIGLNCCQKSGDFDESVRGLATSISMTVGFQVDRNLVASRIFNSLEKWLKIVKDDTEAVLIPWSRRSTLIGKRITLIYDRREYVGNCIGIDPVEGLILQLDGGAVKMFATAHTSFA